MLLFATQYQKIAIVFKFIKTFFYWESILFI